MSGTRRKLILQLLLVCRNTQFPGRQQTTNYTNYTLPANHAKKKKTGCSSLVCIRIFAFVCGPRDSTPARRGKMDGCLHSLCSRRQLVLLRTVPAGTVPAGRSYLFLVPHHSIFYFGSHLHFPPPGLGHLTLKSQGGEECERETEKKNRVGGGGQHE